MGGAGVLFEEEVVMIVGWVRWLWLQGYIRVAEYRDGWRGCGIVRVAFLSGQGVLGRVWAKRSLYVLESEVVASVQMDGVMVTVEKGRLDGDGSGSR